MTWNHIRKGLAQYYISLRMSAALVTPELAIQEIPNPTPIVRQLPSRDRGEWDERELVRGDDCDWIIVRDVKREPQSTFVWN